MRTVPFHAWAAMLVLLLDLLVLYVSMVFEVRFLLAPGVWAVVTGIFLLSVVLVIRHLQGINAAIHRSKLMLLALGGYGLLVISIAAVSWLWEAFGWSSVFWLLLAVISVIVVLLFIAYFLLVNIFFARYKDELLDRCGSRER